MANHGNMYGPSFTFLGIPQCDLDDPRVYADADVIILGAPIDSGTSHRSGAPSLVRRRFAVEIICRMMQSVRTLHCASMR